MRHAFRLLAGLVLITMFGWALPGCLGPTPLNPDAFSISIDGVTFLSEPTKLALRTIEPLAPLPAIPAFWLAQEDDKLRVTWSRVSGKSSPPRFPSECNFCDLQGSGCEDTFAFPVNVVLLEQPFPIPPMSMGSEARTFTFTGINSVDRKGCSDGFVVDPSTHGRYQLVPRAGSRGFPPVDMAGTLDVMVVPDGDGAGLTMPVRPLVPLPTDLKEWRFSVDPSTLPGGGAPGRTEDFSQALFIGKVRVLKGTLVTATEDTFGRPVTEKFVPAQDSDVRPRRIAWCIAPPCILDASECKGDAAQVDGDINLGRCRQRQQDVIMIQATPAFVTGSPAATLTWVVELQDPPPQLGPGQTLGIEFTLFRAPR